MSNAAEISVFIHGVTKDLVMEIFLDSFLFVALHMV